MFGVGFSEIIVIAIIALIFVGPKSLPDVAKQAGRLFVQFKRMTSDVRSTVDEFIRQAEEEIRREEREALMKMLGNKPIEENAGSGDVSTTADPDPHQSPEQTTSTPEVAPPTEAHGPQTADVSPVIPQESHPHQDSPDSAKQVHVDAK